MTDAELLKQRNAIIIPSNLEEAKRLVQFLWKELLDMSFTKSELDYIGNCYNDYIKKHTRFVIQITGPNILCWSSLEYLEGKPDFKNYKLIYQQSNNNIEARNISLTIKQAREWFNGNNKTLRELALKAYSEQELCLSYESIKGSMINSLSCYTSLIRREDFEKADALGKLKTLAYYFNGSWKRKAGEPGYVITKFSERQSIADNRKVVDSIGITENTLLVGSGTVYFRKLEDAKQAAELLGSALEDLFK